MLPNKQKCYKKTFLDFGLFWPFFNQKTAKIDKKLRKLAKSKLFDEIFWNLVCTCFPTKRNATKKFFLDFSFFGRFLTKKQPKLTKNEENWQNLNRLMKFSEIWYVDASQQKKCFKKLFLDFGLFGRFLTKKQSKFTKNEEYWWNPNRLMKFSEVWYVDASQQQKMLQKTVKIDQKWRKLAKSKPFDEIFWNLVCRCLPTKKML